MSVPTVLLGGKHIDGGRPNALATNPLKRFLIDGDLNSANQWTTILFNTNGTPLTSEEKETISTAVYKTYSSDQSCWNLPMLYTFVRGMNQQLAMRLQPFIDTSESGTDNGRGLFSGYFDAEEDAYELSDIMCFECSKVIKIPDVSSAFLFYVTYCIEKGLDGSTPTLIFIEESWHYFKNPAFAEVLEDWARTLRKKLAFLVLVTQGAKEFDSIPCGDVIINMSPTKIFLPIITAMTEKEKARYRDMFGVNEDVFKLIERAIPKRDYVIMQPGVTKLVISKMPELTIASNDASAVETMRNKAFDHVAKGSVNWEKTYIRESLNVAIQ
jgi:type IV secretion system protein VirB4